MTQLAVCVAPPAPGATTTDGAVVFLSGRQRADRAGQALYGNPWYMVAPGVISPEAAHTAAGLSAAVIIAHGQQVHAVAVKRADALGREQVAGTILVVTKLAAAVVAPAPQSATLFDAADMAPAGSDTQNIRPHFIGHPGIVTEPRWPAPRSEERRVGKECRARGAT